MLRRIIVHGDTRVLELHQIKLIIGLLHKLLPVIVMVIAAVLKEPSGNKLWLHGLLCVGGLTVWQFNGLPCALPAEVESLIEWVIVLFLGPLFSLLDHNLL